MNAHWHEQIQRCVAGDAEPKEIAALQQALKKDAELRAFYLDYLNLDMALGAAAEAATITENRLNNTTAVSPHHWRWLAATAACAALVALALLPAHRDSSQTQPDIADTISSTQGAIARLSIEPPSLFPAWSSPTASLLDLPRIPQ